MNRNAILIGLLVAACGGTSAPSSEPALGSTHVGSTAGLTGSRAAPAPAPDPALPFRLAYANPGGMWLPEQMTLPGHVEAFKNLGVHLDPAALSKPLAAPL